MQSQSVQAWVGCSQTVSLARVMLLEQPAEEPVLCEDSPIRIGLPPSEHPLDWKPGAAEDLSIATAEEPHVPLPTLASVHTREYPVSEAAAKIESGPDLDFQRRFARGLWNDVTRASEDEVEALRVSPDGPTEIKFRIWMQPMEDSPLHQLQHAPNRPCPAVTVPELENLTMALTQSDTSGEIHLPEVDGGAVRGVEARGGASLQSAVRLPETELEPLLYPGTRRMPIPTTITFA